MRLWASGVDSNTVAVSFDVVRTVYQPYNEVGHDSDRHSVKRRPTGLFSRVHSCDTTASVPGLDRKSEQF